MQYYLIDENRIRIIYQNEIVTKQKVDNTIVLKDVSYILDKNTLKLNKVTIANKDVDVLTTEGFVKLENPSYSINNLGQRILMHPKRD